MTRRILAFSFSLLLLAVSAQAEVARAEMNTLVMPAERLAGIKAALPQVADPKLAAILTGAQTLWYDETVMKRSYQDSIGASSNDKWPDLVAAPESIIGGLHDRANHRWQFPFATTAGTDESTNLRVENFAYFPEQNGRVQTTTIKQVIMNYDRPEWMWTYQPGTVFGEVLFITDGERILPTEIRTRTRFAAGWAMNVYRPFPHAADLADAIKLRRPNWNDASNLRSMIDYLGDNTTLQPASLKAQAALAPTFSQEGYLDVLPDFGDDQLVRKLLTTTMFRSAYDTNWKSNGERKTYAASTKSPMSIVPTHYTGGLLQVTDDKCMRCHKETSRLVSDFYPELYLYGQIWGMDGIFSFHPYDESRYPELRLDMVDNRHLNSKLRDAGIFRTAFK